MKKKIEVGLIRGRHEMPVTGYIFEEIANPLDFEFLNNHVYEWCEDNIPSDSELVVFVTGLTAATAAVIRECAIRRTALTLMHYDRDTDAFVPQHIFA